MLRRRPAITDVDLASTSSNSKGRECLEEEKNSPLCVGVGVGVGVSVGNEIGHTGATFLAQALEGECGLVRLNLKGMLA